jgi:chemotaxis protein methyltransferase CheR
MSLTDGELTYVVDLVRRESSIVLGPEKAYLIEARLRPLARAAGVDSVSELLTRAQRGTDGAVRQRVVDAMTTNETSWFRDREPFAALSETVIPDLLRARAGSRRLRVWSAACSSGQEPYSLAIELRRCLPPGWTYEILCTDISAEMLQRARKGEYTQLEINRGLPADMLLHHFERSGPYWSVVSGLRQGLTFQRLNLAGAIPAMAAFDLIFLRNLLIYFNVETKRSVLQGVRRLLQPDGWLFLGSAETTIGIDESYTRVPAGKTSAYRHRAAASAVTAGQG